MGNISAEWLSALHRKRFYDIDIKDKENSVPIVPWIHPPLNQDIVRLLIKVGKKVSLKRQEKLISLGQSIHHLAVVTNGVTARNFGNPTVATEKAAAISPVGHLALGNLNFFTGRPAFGHYFALTNAEIYICDRELIMPILKTEPTLLAALIRHFESCALSDRIGLALMAFSPVEQRLKAFAISWAIHFADSFYKDGKMWLRMPVPLTRSNRCLVANASSVSTDNYLKKWKDEGVWIREGDYITFPVDFFEDAYKWMRHSEEQSSYTYASSLKELFELMPRIPQTINPLTSL